MNYVRKVKRRGSTRWVIDIPYRSPEGRNLRYRRDAQVQTRTAANAEAQRLLVRLATTGTLEDSNKGDDDNPITVGDAVEHYKLVDLPKKKPSTQRGYNVTIDAYVMPRLAHRPLSDLNRKLFIEFDTELVEAGLSASSRRNILVVLRRILRTAVDAGWLEHMPHLPPLPRVGRTVVRSMSWETAEAILGVAYPAFYLAALLARDAGLRSSEIRGLQWSDVDLKLREITIRRAITHGVTGTPKSGHERTIPLTEKLYEALVEAKKKMTSPWGPVAPNSEGRIWSEHGLRYGFRVSCKRAGVEGWRFHDLRHFFVSKLFRHGASAPVVQRLAGHEVLTTTQRYAHADDDECREAIAAFSERRPRR